MLKNLLKSRRRGYGFIITILAFSMLFSLYSMFPAAPAALDAAFSASLLLKRQDISGKGKIIAKNPEYYTDGKMYITLKMSKNLKAYINKKNQKVYYYYKKRYYFWADGIWFEAGRIKGMFSITPQNEVPRPLKHGPLLRVKRKKIPAGFAALKVPPRPVKQELPNAATEHLYNLPLTLHGLVIYQKNFNFNKINK